MINKDNCAIFIPTYKRSEKVYTYEYLRKSGWKDKIYLIVGDDDPELENYKRLYKDEVYVFSKDNVKDFDMMDNFDGKNCVVFARNVMWEVAKELNIDYFLVLDDDYSSFMFRRVYTRGDKEILKGFVVKNITDCIYACFNYLDKCKTLDCFALSQGGDFIGGAGTYPQINGKRKIMNAFFFAKDRPIKFLGRINEDLNASVYYSQRGKVFFTINDMGIEQMTTQANSGGLTDIYLDLGTFVKSFYSVIACPNCVKISAMGNNDLRLHHKVKWNKTAPKIINEKWRK